ncbi:hypothetical protein [Rhizobium sp. Pop5]|uniref:hypothetical protein n=1 Tax=Rhizobium sp. Pop5 TaxID=1223565 RepID=UPI0002838FD7|nr:hypothetical protein RCCGEPOP_27499 [Rhizobium sp. Pop5]
MLDDFLPPPVPWLLGSLSLGLNLLPVGMDRVGMHSRYSSVPRTAVLQFTTAGAAVARLLLARRKATATLNFDALLLISIVSQG